MRSILTLVMLLVLATTVCNAANQTTKLRTWTSASGKSVEAEYVGLEHGKVKLRTADGTLVAISARSLSDGDQAWIKEEEARRNAPAGIRRPEKPHELPVFQEGKWKDYHSVYTARNFDACMTIRGSVQIYPKENGTRVGKPMSLYVDCYYRDDDRVYFAVPRTAYLDCPDPVEQPKTVTLAGVLHRDVPFDVTYEFSEEGIKAYGGCQDTREIKHPTMYRLRVKVPPSHKFEDFATAEERNEALEDWWVVTSPVEGKRRTFGYAESLTSMGGKNKQVTIDAPVYGRRKICFKTGNAEDANLAPSVYSGKSLWQGYSVSYTKDEGDAKSKSLYLEVVIE